MYKRGTDSIQEGDRQYRRGGQTVYKRGRTVYLRGQTVYSRGRTVYFGGLKVYLGGQTVYKGGWQPVYKAVSTVNMGGRKVNKREEQSIRGDRQYIIEEGLYISGMYSI